MAHFHNVITIKQYNNIINSKTIHATIRFFFFEEEEFELISFLYD